MFGKKDEGSIRKAFEYKVKFVHKPDQWQEPNSKFNSRLNEHIDSRGISVATTFYFKREIETAPPN